MRTSEWKLLRLFSGALLLSSWAAAAGAYCLKICDGAEIRWPISEVTLQLGKKSFSNPDYLAAIHAARDAWNQSPAFFTVFTSAVWSSGVISPLYAPGHATGSEDDATGAGALATGAALVVVSGAAEADATGTTTCSVDFGAPHPQRRSAAIRIFMSPENRTRAPRNRSRVWLWRVGTSLWRVG